MALVYSTMMPLGATAPDFSLPDTVSGAVVSLKELPSQQCTVVMFICNHCPFVRHIADKLSAFCADFKQKGVSFIAISANDVITHPDDAPDKMAENAKAHGFSFPYLYDESQAVAKAYDAACTPDFFVFDSHLKCVYRGRFDASSPGNNVPVTGNELGAALNAVLANQPVDEHQNPSMGCNIKWK